MASIDDLEREVKRLRSKVARLKQSPAEHNAREVAALVATDGESTPIRSGACAANDVLNNSVFFVEFEVVKPTNCAGPVYHYRNGVRKAFVVADSPKEIPDVLERNIAPAEGEVIEILTSQPFSKGTEGSVVLR